MIKLVNKTMMRQFLAAVILVILFSSAVGSHPFIDYAVPGVGLTVNYSPNVLHIFFTDDLAKAQAKITTQNGKTIYSQSIINARNGALLEIHLFQPLKPGIYLVHYQITDDEHHEMAGKYKFTVGELH